MRPEDVSEEDHPLDLMTDEIPCVRRWDGRTLQGWYNGHRENRSCESRRGITGRE